MSGVWLYGCVPIFIDVFGHFSGVAIFTTAELVQTVVQQILIAAGKCGYDVMAYCGMPDHFHLVAQGKIDSVALPKFIHKARQLSGYHGKRVSGRRVWHEGYYDRVLRESEDTRVVVAYVLRNPVREGLVSKPEDYAFSGSGIGTLTELIESVRSFL